jgi:hypothetical protein
MLFNSIAGYQGIKPGVPVLGTQYTAKALGFLLPGTKRT